VLAAVADFTVLRPDPATGLRAHRDFRAGEAYADYQRQLAGIRQAVTEAGAETAGPDHVAIGTDLDGNYRPVLTSYDQFDDLTGLLAARGLPAAHNHQILGGNAMKLLGRVL
jgi:microsomal dipeptidase-like Zn-dependent dipeptidase